jgi:hypothetical protein
MRNTIGDWNRSQIRHRATISFLVQQNCKCFFPFRHNSDSFLHGCFDDLATDFMNSTRS